MGLFGMLANGSSPTVCVSAIYSLLFPSESHSEPTNALAALLLNEGHFSSLGVVLAEGPESELRAVALGAWLVARTDGLKARAVKAIVPVLLQCLVQW